VLDGGLAEVAGPADGDVVALRRGEIDRGVRLAGADQELQLGQPIENLGRELGAFAHCDDHRERGEPADHLLAAGEGLGEHLNVGGQGITVGAGHGHVLVVVQNRDPHRTSPIRAGRR
jgi:hypothetical protein